MHPIDALRALGISQRRLAGILGHDEGSLRQMLRGSRTMPADMRAWLEALAAWVEQHPPPARSR